MTTEPTDRPGVQDELTPSGEPSSRVEAGARNANAPWPALIGVSSDDLVGDFAPVVYLGPSADLDDVGPRMSIDRRSATGGLEFIPLFAVGYAVVLLIGWWMT